MGETAKGGVPPVLLMALGLVLGASGCLPMPPPLMYPQTPVPAGHVSFGGAVAGSYAIFGPLVSKASPFPGLQLSGRYGLGHGASLGLSISGGPDVMLDGRLEVLHTPHLSLSLGAELGVIGLPGSVPAIMCTTNGPCAQPTPGLALGGMADVPVVLGLSLGRSTLWLGARPGVMVSSTSQVAGMFPLAGGLVGVSIPIEHVGALALQLDVTHDYGVVGNTPRTVFTAAVGLTR